MKSFIQLLAASLVLCIFRSHSVQAITLTVIGTYEIAFGESTSPVVGGGFIDGDDLFIFRDIGVDGSRVVRIPLARNTTSGQIIGFGNGGAPVADAFTADHLFSSMTKGPGGLFFYGIESNYWPYGTGIASFDNTTKTLTKVSEITPATYSSLGKTITTVTYACTYALEGLLSIAFSPAVKDPNTNFGMMTGSNPEGIWQIPMTVSGTTYTPTTATFLCTIPDYYANGFMFIPAGTYKNSALHVSYDNNSVYIVHLDPTSGYCIDKNTNTGVLGTTTPKLTTIMTGLTNPFGLIVDPKTNDFLLSTDGGIVQVTGFPPGIDFGVVIGNINTKIANAVKIITGVRRELTDTEDHGPLRGDGGRSLKKVATKQKISAKPSIAPKPKKIAKKGKGSKKASKKALKKSPKKTKSPSSGSGGGSGGSLVLPSAATIADDIVANGESVLTDLLNKVINDSSYQTSVLSGGDATIFQTNIDTLKASITILGTKAIANSSDKATFDSLIADIQALLDLMRNAVEK